MPMWCGSFPAAGRSKGGRPKVDAPKRNILTMRGSEEWREWLNGLAEFCRLPTTTLVDHAVIKYAKDVGYEVAPPKR